MASFRVRHGRFAWLIGVSVLIALGVALTTLFRDGQRLPLARLGPPAVEAGPARAVAPALQLDDLQQTGGEPTVRGVVLLPDGRPAAGAAVTVYRLLTAWPEWKHERIDQAITGADGRFQFRCDDERSLLVGVLHRGHALDLVEVLDAGMPLELRLQTGFDLFGFVYQEGGQPVRNARVSIESLPGDQRRCVSVTTSDSGRYEFENVRPGPVRVVARHERFWPATEPAILVGDQRRCDLRFERPALPPLKGRVQSASSKAPVADALVQLVPRNRHLGLTDPISSRTAADGTFVLNGLGRGSARLFVRHPDHGGVELAQSIGAVNQDLVVEMPPRSVVQGRVVDEHGAGLEFAGAVLQIVDSTGQAGFAPVDAEGRFRCVSPLSPGRANLRVLDRQFEFSRALASEITVRIEEQATTTLEQPVVPSSRLRGRVVDAENQPIAGAVLTRTRLLAENALSIGEAALQLDLGAVGSQVAQLFGADRDEVLAVSGKDGLFEIRGHKSGPLLVRLAAREKASRLLRLTAPSPGATEDLGALTMSPGCRLRGHVLRNRRPLIGATVVAISRGRDSQTIESQSMVVTDAAGEFWFDDLLAGDYRVRARLPSLPSGSKEQEVTTRPDRPQSLNLVLEAARTVRGLVTGRDGQPLGAVFVGVRGFGVATTSTDGNGEFMLELPDRAVELQVLLGDRGRMVAVPVPLGQQRVNIMLDTPPTCVLLAQVAALSGKRPLPAALLRLTSLDGDDDGDVHCRWLELAEGLLRWPECPVGRFRIEIWSEGYAPWVTSRELISNQEHDLGELLLEPGARLAGVVQDDRGQPVAEAAVLLGDEADLDLFAPRLSSEADGSFRLSGVTSRSARVVVRAPGWAVATVDLILPGDVLSASPLVIRLQRGTMVEVQVADELVGERRHVQLRQAGRVLASALLDERGRAWFANRRAGSYSVQLLGSEEPPQAVVVPAGANVVRVQLP